MAGGSENGSDDDLPVTVSFKQLKKDKFLLSTNLKNDFEQSKMEASKKKHFRDPRFDPRVNGVCTLSDWSSLKDEQDGAVKVIVVYNYFH